MGEEELYVRMANEETRADYRGNCAASVEWEFLDNYRHTTDQQVLCLPAFAFPYMVQRRYLEALLCLQGAQTRPSLDRTMRPRPVRKLDRPDTSALPKS